MSNVCLSITRSLCVFDEDMQKHIFTLNRWINEVVCATFDKATTVDQYLINVRELYKQLKEVRPEPCRLPEKAITTIIAFLDSQIKSNKRAKREHLFQVKADKLELLHKPEEIKKAFTMAKEEIPGLLGKSISNLTIILITGLYELSIGHCI